MVNELGISAEQAAWGVFEVVCEQMAAATRTHATDRGIDYRGLPMLAFGGAGPVHACMVADLIDSSKVIYPPLASVLSAFGTLVTPVQINLIRSMVADLDILDWELAGSLLDSMVEEGSKALAESGIREADYRFGFAIELRYVGQQTEVHINLPGDPRRRQDVAGIRKSFEAEYERQYGLKLDGMSVEVVNWLVTASGPQPNRGRSLELSSAGPEKPKQRTVFLAGRNQPVRVYQRSQITKTEKIPGPAIIEERETTIFILENWTATLHESGSLVAEKKEA